MEDIEQDLGLPSDNEDYDENDFHKTNYFDFELTIHSKTGYINAKVLCEDNNKHFVDWHRLDATNRLREAFCKTRGIEATCVGCEKRLGNRNAFDTGYYCY